MKIAVVGTGAIGGYYGAMLAQRGHEVHFLLRSDYELVKAAGLKIISSVHKDVYLRKVNAYQEVANMPKADIVLVCLKTTQNNQLLPQLLPHLAGENSLIILIQNGLGMEADLHQQLPHLQIAGGTALIGAYKAQQGTIVHQEYGQLDLGSYNLKDNTLLETLSRELAAAGVPSTIAELNYLRWKKLVWNMTFNGLSVVQNKTTEQLLSNPLDIQRCKTVMAEVVQAAAACAVCLPATFVNDTVTFTQKMGGYFPSMKQDYDNGREMELEYMYRRPIEAAKAAGFDMPTNEELYQELCRLSATSIDIK